MILIPFRTTLTHVFCVACHNIVQKQTVLTKLQNPITQLPLLTHLANFNTMRVKTMRVKTRTMKTSMLKITKSKKKPGVSVNLFCRPAKQLTFIKYRKQPISCTCRITGNAHEKNPKRNHYETKTKRRRNERCFVFSFRSEVHDAKDSHIVYWFLWRCQTLWNPWSCIKSSWL